MDKKPLVAVMPLYDTKLSSLWMIPGYFDGLKQAGAIPVMLPLDIEKSDVKDLVDEFDGFLITGGQDVDPSIYGEEKKEECGEPLEILDDLEKNFLDEIIIKNKPCLGICRGIQFINAALGGSLYQDIPTQYKTDVNHHQSAPFDVPVHSVTIKKDNLLHSIVGVDNLDVNSYHHQAIKELSKELKCVAISEDGLVEGVVKEDQDFFLAVQWHPELCYKKSVENKKIFDAFVASMKK